MSHKGKPRCYYCNAPIPQGQGALARVKDWFRDRWEKVCNRCYQHRKNR